MEAKYENSVSLRLAILNSAIALAQIAAFNLGETAKSIAVTFEREDGTTVTEHLSADDIEMKVAECVRKGI